MWNCPKCGRTFRNTNQSHYCGKAPQTIAEYILDQPKDIRPLLRTLCEAIHAAIPEAKEKISWSMPTFWNGCNLIQFAAFPKHIGLYPGPEAVEAFAYRLTDYQTSKGTIRLPSTVPCRWSSSPRSPGGAAPPTANNNETRPPQIHSATALLWKGISMKPTVKGRCGNIRVPV